ncbi:hypothetical protein M427DRAFT_319270 [Gonapodya prolifera JEL478]|uniref:MICOS complex subunit n=1 Tax=Gonapodya prolifera (strain JEL478) TaxID=1344416 RepID=A0A139AXF5_GONPJ|nr:hypothetical protein M427DRAFT_319270 [Gonapodya prolifera JEL478]|eukprot:KXS21426.1 hypothetical protein M427DRAFT_319270 [Gonapodya prolifera JEL478]
MASHQKLLFRPGARSLGLVLGVSASLLGSGIVFADQRVRKSIYDPKEPEYDTVEAATVLEVQIRNSRHSLAKYFESTNALIKSSVEQVVKFEQDTMAAFRSVVSEGEDFTPGSLYVATATFGTMVWIRKSNVVVRLLTPLLAFDAAMLYFYPKTSDKVVRKVLAGTPYVESWDQAQKATSESINSIVSTTRDSVNSTRESVTVFMSDAVDIIGNGVSKAVETVEGARKSVTQFTRGAPVAGAGGENKDEKEKQSA